jgi:hypothetical protein
MTCPETESPYYVVFTFVGTHQAIAAEEALLAAGMALEVVPPPPEASAGCGLALRMRQECAKEALNTLRGRKLAFSTVYLLDGRQRVIDRLE